MLIRSRFLFAISALVMAVTGSTAIASADSSFEVRLRGDQAMRTRIPSDILKSLKVERDESPQAVILRGRAPDGRDSMDILVVSGTLPIGVIADVIAGMTREVYFGGVSVDATRSPPEISSDPKVSARTVAIKAADGSTQEVKASDVTPDQLAKALGK